jgi:hypothetical protein
MTQPVNDPWAAASATPPPAAPAPAYSAPAGASVLADAYEAPEGDSILFGGAGGAPSLFNKTHFVGTERTGVITGLTDKQDMDFNTRSPKFWSASKTGSEKGNSPVTTDPVDKITGERNKPVMSAHLALDTSYRLTAQEAMAVNPNRDASEAVASDDGSRVLVIKGGADLKAFKKAMGEAQRNGIRVAAAADLNGLRITAKRAGQIPNQTGNPSWVMEYRIERA